MFDFLQFLKAKPRIRAGTKEIIEQAERSLKEDKIRPDRFFYGLKPVRVTEKGMPQSPELVIKYIEAEDYPVFVSKKYDGYRVLVFKKGNEVKIISEDGTDNTERFPNIVEEFKKLTSEDAVFDCEVELWINGEHYPREAVAAYVHRKDPPDDSNFVFNCFTIPYFKKDLHKEPESVRQALLKEIDFPMSTMLEPNFKKGHINRVPNIIAHNEKETLKAIKEVASYPGSEGAVIKKHNAIYYLDTNSRNGWLKWHKAFLVTVEVIEVKETKVKGVYNYLYGIPCKKFADRFLSTKGEFLVVGKTFSTEIEMKVGDRFILEGETLNLVFDYNSTLFDIGIWAPRVIGKTDKQPNTLEEVIMKAFENEVLVYKEIFEDGNSSAYSNPNPKLIIEKLQVDYFGKIKDIDNYEPSKMKLEQLHDDFRIALAWWAQLERGIEIEGVTKKKVYNLLKAIVAELIKRGKTRFHPENMRESSRQVLYAVLRDLLQVIYLNDSIVDDIKAELEVVFPPGIELGDYIVARESNGKMVGAIKILKEREYLIIAIFHEELSEIEDIAPKAALIKGRDYLTPKDPFMRIPSEDRTYKFVAQHHFRGKTCHTDPRMELVKGEVLIKFTLADLIRGTIKEPVTTLEQAKKIDSEPEKYFKINWKTGEWKKRQRGSKLVNVEIAAVKAAPEPFEWLEFEGVTPPGSVGATKNYPGVFHIIDRGTVEYGAQKPWFHEYFYHGKGLNYRVVFRRIANIWKKIEGIMDIPLNSLNSFHKAWLQKSIVEHCFVFPSFDEIDEPDWEEKIKFDHLKIYDFWEIAKNEVLPPSEGEFGRGDYGWLAIKPEDQLPYVLSDRAVEEGWIPPLGFSALPRSIKKQIPKEYRYWTVGAASGMRKVRDELVELMKKGEIKLNIPTLKKAVKGKFAYQRIMEKGQLVIRVTGKTYYALRLDIGGKYYALIMEHSLPEIEEYGAEEVVLKEEKENYLNLEGYIEPSHPANETKNTPMFVEILDKGNLIVYLDNEEVKKFKLEGKKVKGYYLMTIKGEKTWKLQRVEGFPQEERG